MAKPIVTTRALRTCAEPTLGAMLTDDGMGSYDLVIQGQHLRLNLVGLTWVRDAIDSLLAVELP